MVKIGAELPKLSRK